MTRRRLTTKDGRGRVTLSRGGPPYREGGDNTACRDALYRDFDGRCAYCLWHARLSPDEHQIDHFRPRSRGGTHKYANLRFSCGSCNRRKGHWLPSGQHRRGERILDPCAEWDYGDHLVERQDHHLDALTAEGRFHLERLRLNRSNLVEQRRRRDERIAHCEELSRLALADGLEDADRLRALSLLRLEEQDLSFMLPRLEDLLAQRR